MDRHIPRHRSACAERVRLTSMQARADHAYAPGAPPVQTRLDTLEQRLGRYDAIIDLTKVSEGRELKPTMGPRAP